MRLQTDKLTFNGANEVEVTITNAAALDQTAADRVWSSSSRSLTTFGSLVADVWNVVCETAGVYTAKQIMSLLLGFGLGATANGRTTFKTPDGTATRAVVPMVGNERGVVTLTPSA
jgi:hypothetical protein